MKLGGYLAEFGKKNATEIINFIPLSSHFSFYKILQHEQFKIYFQAIPQGCSAMTSNRFSQPGPPNTRPESRPLLGVARHLSNSTISTTRIPFPPLRMETGKRLSSSSPTTMTTRFRTARLRILRVSTFIFCFPAEFQTGDFRILISQLCFPTLCNNLCFILKSECFFFHKAQ